MSDTVARTGCPCSPQISHSVTGQARHRGSGNECSDRRAFILSLSLPAAAQPGQIPLDVRHEYRHADIRKALRHFLHRHCLAGAGGAGDAAVSIRQRRKQRKFGLAGHCNHKRFSHQCLVCMGICDSVAEDEPRLAERQSPVGDEGPLLHSRPFVARTTLENLVMAGHSKWANIQHRKNRQDVKRGSLWTKIIREVTVAARDGGGDPGMNPRLRLALDKARLGNVPKDKLTSAIQRGAGKLEGASYEEIRYEGYGIGGAALMIDAMTDNRVRTVAEVRHALAKNGGNLGTDGSVAFNFKHCGQFLFAPGTPEEKVMDIALDAGAEDVIANDDGTVEVISSPADFEKVRAALDGAGLKPELAEVTMKPLAETVLSGDDAERMQKLLDTLEDLDDVQQVYTTAALVQ